MRWDALFADLDAQWQAQADQRFQAEVQQARELERSQLLLADRLRAHLEDQRSASEQLSVLLRGGRRITCCLESVGADWIAGSAGVHSLLMPLPAVLMVESLARTAAQETSPTRRRLTIAAPLRALMNDRAGVAVFGEGADGDAELAAGRLIAVGKDHFDVLMPAADGHAPERDGRSIRTIPLNAVALIRSLAGA
ncbi:hypothetical protein [Nesterenkonia rhizosphaerae]|uniref:DUF222 domain-containing protein n=1 Tax=Nesterenkonia rhizosphaerae TaxID=1348272 RepID=A0ABP9FNU6_9MICC